MDNGFTIVDSIYTATEVEIIIDTIHRVDSDKPTFRISADLFAIRQFLKEVPAVCPLIFNGKLKSLIKQTHGEDYFLAMSLLNKAF